MCAFEPLEALILKVADREGFEPSLPCGKHAFQACAIDHSAICPDQRNRCPAGRRARNCARSCGNGKLNLGMSQGSGKTSLPGGV